MLATLVSSLTEELQMDKRRSRGLRPSQDFTFLFMFVRLSSIILFVHFINKTLH